MQQETNFFTQSSVSKVGIDGVVAGQQQPVVVGLAWIAAGKTSTAKQKQKHLFKWLFFVVFFIFIFLNYARTWKCSCSSTHSLLWQKEKLIKSNKSSMRATKSDSLWIGPTLFANCRVGHYTANVEDFSRFLLIICLRFCLLFDLRSSGKRDKKNNYFHRNK